MRGTPPNWQLLAAAWIRILRHSQDPKHHLLMLGWWLRESAENCAAFLRESAGERSPQVIEVRNVVETLVAAPATPSAPSQSGSAAQHQGLLGKWRLIGLVASIAVLAALLGAQGTIVVLKSWEAGGEVHSTEKGRQRRITLPDASTVDLDGSTVTRARFSEAARILELERGQVLLRATSDPERPFILRSAAMDVYVPGQVLSARFAQESQALDIVTSDGGTLVAGDHHEVIPPGSSAIVQRGIITVQRASLALIEQRLFPGQLVLSGQTLGAAVHELNRHSTTRLIVSDPAVAEIPIGGNLRPDSQENFLAAINALFGLVAVPTVDANGMRVLRLIGGNLSQPLNYALAQEGQATPHQATAAPVGAIPVPSSQGSTPTLPLLDYVPPGSQAWCGLGAGLLFFALRRTRAGRFNSRDFGDAMITAVTASFVPLEVSIAISALLSDVSSLPPNWQGVGPYLWIPALALLLMSEIALEKKLTEAWKKPKSKQPRTTCPDSLSTQQDEKPTNPKVQARSKRRD